MAVATEGRREPSPIGRLTHDELVDLLIEAKARERQRQSDAARVIEAKQCGEERSRGRPETPLTLVDDKEACFEESDDRAGSVARRSP